MIRAPYYTVTTLEGVTPKEGTTMEDKMEKLLNNNEPMDDGGELIFTEAKEGVKPEFDIRTHKWDVVTNASEKLAERRKLLKKEEAPKEPEQKVETPKGESGDPSQ